MTPVELTLRDHRICYAIELSQVHAGWMARWLYEGNHTLAVESFERFKKVSEGIVREMDAIGAALKQAEAIGDEAAEWRAARDSTRRSSGKAA